MNFTVLDYETYFDDSYSLKKLTTEAYVRDPRFKIHCAAITTTDGERKVFTDNFRENLAPYMNGFVICQKAQFDGLILSHHLGLTPKYWGCTLSMARAQLQFLKSHSLSSLCEYYGLPEKTIDYNAFKGQRELEPLTMEMLTKGCLNDAELTMEIAKRLLAEIPPQELQIIDLTIRMFTQPLLELDTDIVIPELARIKKSKEDALERLGVEKSDLQSSKKFGWYLEQCGVPVPMKLSPSKPKKLNKVSGIEEDNYIPALSKTDEAMKQLLEHEDEIVAALAAARLEQKSTLMETRCERLLGMASRGALTVYLNYHGAHTGRWSGGDKVNFQNLVPILKKAIKAPEGYKLIGADSAQIECRLLNWFCGQDHILEAFAQGRDLYCEGATKFFGREITKADNDERQYFKTIELGCGFGLGWFKFQNMCFQKLRKRISEQEAKKAIYFYRDTHPKVKAMWDILNEVIRSMGEGVSYQIGCITIRGYKIYMPDGTFLDYTGLYEKDGQYFIGESKVYGGLVTENIIQKLANIVIKHVIINMANKYDYPLVMTTHDDLLYLAPKDDGEALDRLLVEMRSPPDWCKDIPLGAEDFEGERYSKK